MLTEQQRQIIRENSRDDASYERLVQLFEDATSNHLIETISAMIPDAIYVVDFEEHRTIWQNRGLNEIVGYPREEVDATIFKRIFDQAEMRHYYEMIGRLMRAQDGEIVESEFRYRHGSGEERWVNIRDVILNRHPDGRVRQVVGIAHDITARKRMEIALRENEGRYRSVVDAMAEGVVLQDRSGQVIACNTTAERILGLSRNEMLGRTSMDPRWGGIHEDGSPFHGEHHPAMVTLRTGRPMRDVVMGVRQPDGGVVWISINSQPIQDEDTTHAVVTTFVDIGERKQIEDALQDNLERMAFVLDAANLGTWDWDLATGVVQIDKRFAEMVGYTVPELLPLLYADMNELIHPHDREAVMATLQAHFDGKTDHYESRHRVRTKSGDWIWIMDVGRVLHRDASGKPLRAVGIHMDITDQMQAAERERRFDQERERRAILGRFIQHASHEFRTPLSIIQSSAYLLNRLEDPAKRQRKADQIDTQVKRIERLVDMLVAQTRLDTDVDFDHRPTDINNLVRAIAGDTVRLMLADGLPLVSGDADFLFIALREIVANARRFSPDVVHIHTRRDDGFILIEVVDGGPGIAEADLPHIFERFYRGDDAHSTEGFGLGLSIAQAIVERHQGTITVDTTPGHGTTMRVRLPVTSRT